MSSTRVWYTSAPFLKWAGGKRWLATDADGFAPLDYKRYFEPFLGSGAMFFALRPRHATLSDANLELINCYQQIQFDWEKVWKGLKRLVSMHSEEFYYRVRGRKFTRDSDGAIRFLYLNRACFNGIYRVSLSGNFNVPLGSKTVLIYEYDDFQAVYDAIKYADFSCGDFERMVDRAGSRDFVFCDPPYTVAHSNNGFIKYNDKLFRWDDQIRLRDALSRASRRGASVLLSNADFPRIRDLYISEGFRCTPISRSSVISAKASARGHYDEILISNYPLRLVPPQESLRRAVASSETAPF